MDSVTFLDLLAFNEARKDALAKNEHMPCWMVSSDEAKANMRQIALNRLSTAYGLPLTEQGVKGLIEGAKASLQPLMDEWKRAEMAMKAERKKGNPQAFFA